MLGQVRNKDFNDGKWYLIMDYRGPDNDNGRLFRIGGFNEKFAPKSHQQGMRNATPTPGTDGATALLKEKNVRGLAGPL